MNGKFLRATFLLSTIAIVASWIALILLFQQSVTGQLLLDLDVRPLKNGIATGSLITKSDHPDMDHLLALNLDTNKANSISEVGSWHIEEFITSPLSNTITTIHTNGRSSSFSTLTTGVLFTTPITIAHNVLSAAWSADGDYLHYTVTPTYTHFVWDKETEQSRSLLPILSPQDTYHWSPITPILAAHTIDEGTIIVSPDGEVRHRFQVEMDGLIGWSSDGQRLHYWVDTESGDEFRELIIESGATKSILTVTDQRYAPLIVDHRGDQIALTIVYSQAITSTAIGIVNYPSRTYTTIDLLPDVQQQDHLAADMVWSPDDTHLAFVANTHQPATKMQKEISEQSEIFVLNTISKTVKQITTNRWDDHTVQWSPDSTMVLFQSAWPRQWSHFIAPINGKDYYMIKALDTDIKKLKWVESIEQTKLMPTPTIDLSIQSVHTPSP